MCIAKILGFVRICLVMMVYVVGTIHKQYLVAFKVACIQSYIVLVGSEKYILKRGKVYLGLFRTNSFDKVYIILKKDSYEVLFR